MALESDLRGDAGVDLSDWLLEATRRKTPDCPAEAQSEAELIRHLEKLAGSRMRTREDISAFVQSLRTGQTTAEKKRDRRRLAWESMLLVVAVGAYLQYYFWNVYIEIEALPRVVVFSPVKAPKPQPSTSHLRGT